MKTKYLLNIETSDLEKLKTEAEQKDIPVSQIIRGLIKKHLEK